MYSDILEKCKTKENIQRLVYWSKDEGRDIVFGFPIFYNRSCIPMNFDPWSGQLIKENYVNYEAIRNGTAHEIENFEDLPEVFQKVISDRKLHCYGRYCTALESCTRFGERGDSTLIEIPNLRVIGVLNKVKYGGWKNDKVELFFKRNGYQGLEKWEFFGWTSMIYCPFCGAKLPQTLEKELTEILKNEYGLNSWRDYQKAPAEFHSDEWWRKRGL